MITEFPHPPHYFKAFHPVPYRNRVRQCGSCSGCSYHQERDNTGHQSFRKPTHTGKYFNFKSNQLSHVKRGLIQSLRNRASTTWQVWQGLFNKIRCLRCDLQVNGYPQGFTDSVMDSKGSSCPNKEERPLGSVYVYPICEGCFRKVQTYREPI
jgi:hypothetical protein